MSTVELNQDFLEKIKKIEYCYAGKIPEGMGYYVDDILGGNNIDMYAKMYSLPINNLMMLAKISRVLSIYSEVSRLVEMLKQGIEELEQNEVLEYQELVSDLQNQGSKNLNDIDSLKENNEIVVDNDKGTSLLIYPDYIEESKQRTINARSGREEQVQKSIANTINQLKMMNYQDLRKKGCIHQMQESTGMKPYYIDKYAYERIGSTSTKVNYIRLPISEKNRVVIKNEYNMDFDMVYLILYYGDFLNEGCEEKKFYDRARADSLKHLTEILSIINIFGTDFTPQTYEAAKALINNGFKITEDIISVLKDKQSTM